ncbi:vitamin B12/cobalamin outer membrane transporter, partial [Klebsiella pneumoniae]|nr:vitamin B12/cobalamin outer membrane transporter [Klebsiella pneumoniae]
AGFDQGGWGHAGRNDEHHGYSQAWNTGRHYLCGVYASQLIANDQGIKDYNDSSDAGRYAAGAALEDMEQRCSEWGDNGVGGEGAVSG